MQALLESKRAADRKPWGVADSACRVHVQTFADQDRYLPGVQLRTCFCGCEERTHDATLSTNTTEIIQIGELHGVSIDGCHKHRGVNLNPDA